MLNYDKYKDKLISFNNENELINKIKKTHYPPEAHEIYLSKNNELDIVSFGTLIPPKILFSERIINKLQLEQIRNIKFEKYDRIY